MSRWNAGPTVDGLTLDQWLATSFLFENGTYQETLTPEFNQAIQHLGTNAIPKLLSKLRSRPLPGTQVLSSLVVGTPNPQSFAHYLGLDHWFIQRQRALRGFQALGSVPTNAIPEILAMPPSYFTMQAIAAMGTSSLPTLRELARNGSDQIKSHAMSALESSEFDFKREEIVETWIEHLDDPSPSIRLHAARLLGNAKPIRAQPSLPPSKTILATRTPK